MIKSILNFLASKMSCASIVGAQGMSLLKNSFLLESASVELTDSGLSAASVVSTLIDLFADVLNSWIYIIAKYILLFIDFCQMIIYKIGGIDTDLENIVQLPIFKFLLQDAVLKTIGAILIIGLVLLIVATIIAIIKSEFEARLEDKKDAKSSAYKAVGKSLIALFMMVITPFLIVVAIIFSSIMLSSLNNVLNTNETQYATIGGTLFKTAAYNANKYRLYAQDGKRIPILLNFEDPYENGTYGFYTADELYQIYESWNGEQIYDDFARGNFLNFNQTLTYRDGKVYNSNYYQDYERFIATSEQYQVMADFIDYAVSHEITYYIKDSTDTKIDWDRTSSDIKITDGVYDPINKTISITYTDTSNLSPYEDYYTITFETSTASADTPIANAVNTISLILGLNTIMSGGSVSQVNTESQVGPVNITNTSLTGLAQNVEDSLQQLSSLASSANNNGTNFRILERVEGSLNVVRWKTEKTLYNGKEYAVYELEKIVKNSRTGIKETKATVKVAKKDDSLDSKYYVLKEEPNEHGYYEYTNVTIDYYNDNKVYFDTLTPVFKLVTWPEKLYNDLSVIYSDIDFDNIIAYDNWSDALGTYFKTNNNVSDAAVSSFATTLIHPLGLIMSELFLGTTFEGGNGNTSSFSFASAYSEDMIDSIVLSVGGQFDYQNIKYQIDNFIRLYNAQFASVIESLMEYENFDLYGTDYLSVQGYVYKAYLASIMLSDDYSKYLNDIANTLTTSEKLLNLMAISSNSVTYDENGELVYRLEILTNQDGRYQTLHYNDDANSGKAVYSNLGKLRYTADSSGKLSPTGVFIPKATTLYQIVEMVDTKGTEDTKDDETYYQYQIYNRYSGEYINANAPVTIDQFRSAEQSDKVSILKNQLISDELYNSISEEYKQTALPFSAYFTTYFDAPETEGTDPWYNNDSVTQIYIYEPKDKDTSKESTTVSRALLTADGTQVSALKNYVAEIYSKGSCEFPSNTAVDSYYLFEVEKVLDVDTSYLTYGELPQVYQKFIDKIITDIKDDAKKGMFEEPSYLKFLEEYKEDDISMYDVMSAESIGASTAKKYLEDYDNIISSINYYTEELSGPLSTQQTISYTRKLQLEQDKLNKLKKYYIIYGIESYASTQVTSDFTVIVNGHPFYVSQGIVQRELLELIYGNKLTYNSIINKVNNGTRYDSLGEFDQHSFSILSAYANYYINKVKKLATGTISNAEIFSGKLTETELEIVNTVYSIKTGLYKNYTNKTLKALSNEEKSELQELLLTTMEVSNRLISNYISGRTINEGISYSLTIDESYALLSKFIGMGVADEQLYFVEEDYTGIIGDDVGGFSLLKSFLKSFGDLCFDLSRESNLGGVGKEENENILDYVDSLVSVLLTNLEELELGGSFETFSTLNSIDDLNPIVGPISSSTKFVLLDASSKEYIYRLYEIYDTKIQEYEEELGTYNDARLYSTRYINGRYAMQSDSFIYVTGLKNYLNYFRYNTEVSDISEEDFREKYVYDSFAGSLESTEDRLYYYNLYLEAFDDLNLGTNGLYYESLTDLQQKVMRDMSDYYNDAYRNFETLTNGEYSQYLYNKQLLYDFIFKNKNLGDVLSPDDIAAVATSKSISDLFNENINVLNLCNILNYVGIDYDIDKTLADYRLEALNMLISFKERAGESGASIQARYLTLLYLVCCDYTLDTLGNTTIQVDAATKTTILTLAGIQNRAEEHLVGLTYEVLNTDATSDEKYGSVYIICTYNPETDMFEPFVFASEADSYGTAKTSYYSSAGASVKYYPVVAKGVIGPDGLPTAIREVNGYIEFYRETAVIADVGTLGLDMYYMTVEDVSLSYNPISEIVNLWSTILTGKSAAQQIMDAVPIIISSKNLNLCYGTETSYAYHLDGGEFTLNYMFYADSGIQMNCLYAASELNTIILLFGTIVLALSLISAMFGVIRNLYELVLLVIIYPGVLAMYPLKDSLQGNWRKELINKLLVMLGYLLAINCFFFILNLLQRFEISLVLSEESINELKTTYLFGQFDLQSIVSTLTTFMMFLVACTLLKSLPGFFSKIAGVGDDVVKKGDSAREMVKLNIEEASYFSSGYAVDDAVLSKMDKLKSLPLVGSNWRYNRKEKRQLAANKQSVNEYRTKLQDTGRQKLMAENLDKYERRLRRSGRFNNAQINSMKARYKASMESKDFDTLVQESVGAYKRRLARKGVSSATINKAAKAYEDRIRGLEISENAIDKAVKAYETSLNRQIESQRNRREKDKDSRQARIYQHVERLKSQQAKIKKEHYDDSKKKEDKVCPNPNCRAINPPKSKNCKNCGTPLK